MSKKMKTVKEALVEVQAKEVDGKKQMNRFSKKNFETVLAAMINDKDYKFIAARVKSGELEGVEEISTSELFRTLVEKILVAAGMDKDGAKVAHDMEFTKVDGLYEVFAAALYEYMDAGNRFDLLPTKEFKGSIHVRTNDGSKETREAFHPKTRESLGTFETEKSPHKTLGVKSSCPKYLKKRNKIK